MIQSAADVLFDVPEEMNAEIIALIDAITRDALTRTEDMVAAAFGEWCWLVYTIHGDVLEVVDVGCAR